MRISDWSSDVCSSDLFRGAAERHAEMLELEYGGHRLAAHVFDGVLVAEPVRPLHGDVHVPAPVILAHVRHRERSDEHTSAIQSLIRILSSGLCLQKKTSTKTIY